MGAEGSRGGSLFEDVKVERVLESRCSENEVAQSSHKHTFGNSYEIPSFSSKSRADSDESCIRKAQFSSEFVASKQSHFGLFYVHS